MYTNNAYNTPTEAQFELCGDNTEYECIPINMTYLSKKSLV